MGEGNRSDILFSMIRKPIFELNQQNLPNPSSLIALAFQTALEDCNANVKRSNDDQPSTSGRNMVSFRDPSELRLVSLLFAWGGTARLRRLHARLFHAF